MFALGKVEWENGESGLGRSAEETFSGFQKHHSKSSKAKLLLWPLDMTLYDDDLPFIKEMHFSLTLS